MTPHKLAIGNHPVLESLSGLPVLPDWPETLAPEIQEIIVAFRPEGDNPFLQDTLCFRRLESLLEGQKHLLCQVLIHSRHSARLYNRLSESGNEFIPFSLEEGWGRTLFGPGGLVHLDGNGIGYSDNRCLHLVLFGMTTAAEALAMQTLRTAHFPNYVRDHSLRTRITWVDSQALNRGKEFVARHAALMDASYYRFVDLEREEIHTHRPALENQEEFVDTEWEFVQGHPWTAEIRAKLGFWAQSSRWRTVTAFAYPNDEQNLDAFKFLENALKNTPALVRVEDDALIRAAGPAVIPFGMPSGFHDFDLTRRDMGIAVNAVYEATSETGSIPPAIDWADARKRWQGISPDNRLASMDFADSIGVKMRSMGLQEDDWDTLYGMDAPSIRQLSEVEHNRWSVATLLSGMRPPTEEERSQIERDPSLRPRFKAQGVHYDLRAFSELRTDEKGLDVTLYDVALTRSIPLIANTIYKQKKSHD